MKQFLIYHSLEMDASIEKEQKWPELIWWKAVVFKVPRPLSSLTGQGFSLPQVPI